LWSESAFSAAARSGVQHIAERRIFQRGTGADIANHGNAGVNPDTGVAETDAARLWLGAEAAGERIDPNAALTARSAWSGWSTGAPKNASTASPMNSFTIPPSAKIAAHTPSK
jgi:hypothetical protein